MTILGLEFSSEQRSVAVGRDGVILGSAMAAGGRETRAFAMIEEALEKAGIRREEVECLAVGVGPGSYTGIRIDISIAQGWQLARGIKLLGVSSVECLAEQAKERGLSGIVRIVIDAQRGEFYHAEYQISKAAVQPIEALRIVSAKEVAPNSQQFLVGPDVSASNSNTIRMFPEAAALVRLAAHRNDFVAGEKLEPIYLRETTFVKAPPPRTIS
jgi:tRNA threonylcarbamoyladenosine biosynthesis protein TsaB